ncbi:MAG: M48 family metallopeptidase [Chthoniobacteraceae bacterium]
MSECISIDTIAGPCMLRRSFRRTLEISVLPDGHIELVAPMDASILIVKERVSKRLRWIEKQRREFAEMNATRPPHQYCSGSTHRYLGRQYRLKVHRGFTPRVKLIGGYFHVYTPSGTEMEVKEALGAWYRTRASEQFSRRLSEWEAWCLERHLPSPKLHLLSMPKRWGSTHRDGRIYLNPELVKTPSVCVDYVIAHEICHLKYPSHDRAFYRQLEQVFPDWKKVKQRLEESEL